MTAQFQFNVSKNVNEELSISVPDSFSTAPNTVARITNGIALAATPTIAVGSSATMTIGNVAISATPSGATEGPTSYDFSTTGSDVYSYIFSGDGAVNSTDIYDRIGCFDGGVPPWGKAFTLKAWIPFLLSGVGAVTIVSATLTLKSGRYPVEGDGYVRLKVGCDNRNNCAGATPTTISDLNLRSQTSSYLDYISETANPAWNTNAIITFDVTAPIQEILNLAGWAAGNTLAILIVSNGYYSPGAFRDPCSSRHGSAAGTPSLKITTD
jgi:hypothetical protein